MKELPGKLKEVFKRSGTPGELAEGIYNFGRREYGWGRHYLEEDGEALKFHFRFKIRVSPKVSPWRNSVPLCLRPRVTVSVSRDEESNWVIIGATVVPDDKLELVRDFTGFEEVTAEEFIFWLLRTKPGWEGEVTCYNDDRFLYDGSGRETRVIGFDNFKDLPVWMRP